MGIDEPGVLPLPCRANLIVVPSHLVAQWHQELKAHAPTLKVIEVTVKPQHDRVSKLMRPPRSVYSLFITISSFYHFIVLFERKLCTSNVIYFF